MRRDPYRYYRRAMRRGWLSRHGQGYGYPVMFWPPYEPVALAVFAAMARLAYRYRSAFWPFTIAGTMFVLAAVAHRHDAALRAAVAGAVTVAAGCFLGVPHRLLWSTPPARRKPGFMVRAWEACGIDRPAERIYITAVTVVTGGWLSAAIAAGPFTKPLPAIAGTATMILGVPWWAHRRHRARVRIERTIQAWPGMAENMGLPGSRLSSAAGNRWGFTASVILRKGTTAWPCQTDHINGGEGATNAATAQSGKSAATVPAGRGGNVQ
jgi:S-DNA-T family DNA segregation ATPase FtsK/SpoIIIE